MTTPQQSETQVLTEAVLSNETVFPGIQNGQIPASSDAKALVDYLLGCGIRSLSSLLASPAIINPDVSIDGVEEQGRALSDLLLVVAEHAVQSNDPQSVVKIIQEAQIEGGALEDPVELAKGGDSLLRPDYNPDADPDLPEANPGDTSTAVLLIKDELISTLQEVGMNIFGDNADVDEEPITLEGLTENVLRMSIDIHRLAREANVILNDNDGVGEGGHSRSIAQQIVADELLRRVKNDEVENAGSIIEFLIRHYIPSLQILLDKDLSTFIPENGYDYLATVIYNMTLLSVQGLSREQMTTFLTENPDEESEDDPSEDLGELRISVSTIVSGGIIDQLELRSSEE